MFEILGNEYDENTYILYSNNEAYVIDPGTNYQKVLSFLKRSDLNLKGILLTHGHYDHIAGVNGIIKAHAVPVYIHPHDRVFLSEPNMNLSHYMNVTFRVSKLDSIIELKSTLKLSLGENQITFLHTPGHTPGSVVYAYNDSLFTGDTLFFDTVGRTDLPGGDLMSLKTSIKKMLAHYPKEMKVYPGHGESTSIQQERTSNPFYKSA